MGITYLCIRITCERDLIWSHTKFWKETIHQGSKRVVGVGIDVTNCEDIWAIKLITPWPCCDFTSSGFGTKLNLCIHGKRKSTALTVKLSKMQFWENFVHKLDTKYWQASKVFWQITRRLRDKRSHAARSIKDQNGVLLSNKDDILSRWESISKTFLAHSFPHHWKRRRCIWGGNYYCSRGFPEAAALKSNLKCSKPWTEKLVSLNMCVKWPGVLEGHWLIDKLEQWSPYTSREKGENALTTVTSLFH